MRVSPLCRKELAGREQKRAREREREKGRVKGTAYDVNCLPPLAGPRRRGGQV
jgi:hypothetical protein